jgi:hypothetical protein
MGAAYSNYAAAKVRLRQYTQLMYILQPKIDEESMCLSILADILCFCKEPYSFTHRTTWKRTKRQSLALNV